MRGENPRFSWLFIAAEDELAGLKPRRTIRPQANEPMRSPGRGPEEE
jgi:hypothetical protein